MTTGKIGQGRSIEPGQIWERNDKGDSNDRLYVMRDPTDMSLKFGVWTDGDGDVMGMIQTRERWNRVRRAIIGGKMEQIE